MAVKKLWLDRQGRVLLLPESLGGDGSTLMVSERCCCSLKCKDDVDYMASVTYGENGWIRRRTYGHGTVVLLTGGLGGLCVTPQDFLQIHEEPSSSMAVPGYVVIAYGIELERSGELMIIYCECISPEGKDAEGGYGEYAERKDNPADMMKGSYHVLGTFGRQPQTRGDEEGQEEDGSYPQPCDIDRCAMLEAMLKWCLTETVRRIGEAYGASEIPEYSEHSNVFMFDSGAIADGVEVDSETGLPSGFSIEEDVPVEDRLFYAVKFPCGSDAGGAFHYGGFTWIGVNCACELRTYGESYVPYPMSGDACELSCDKEVESLFKGAGSRAASPLLKAEGYDCGTWRSYTAEELASGELSEQEVERGGWWERPPEGELIVAVPDSRRTYVSNGVCNVNQCPPPLPGQHVCLTIAFEEYSGVGEFAEGYEAWESDQSQNAACRRKTVVGCVCSYVDGACTRQLVRLQDYVILGTAPVYHAADSQAQDDFDAGGIEMACNVSDCSYAELYLKWCAQEYGGTLYDAGIMVRRPAPSNSESANAGQATVLPPSYASSSSGPSLGMDEGTDAFVGLAFLVVACGANAESRMLYLGCDCQIMEATDTLPPDTEEGEPTYGYYVFSHVSAPIDRICDMGSGCSASVSGFILKCLVEGWWNTGSAGDPEEAQESGEGGLLFDALEYLGWRYGALSMYPVSAYLIAAIVPVAQGQSGEAYPYIWYLDCDCIPRFHRAVPPPAFPGALLDSGGNPTGGGVSLEDAKKCLVELPRPCDCFSMCEIMMANQSRFGVEEAKQGTDYAVAISSLKTVDGASAGGQGAEYVFPLADVGNAYANSFRYFDYVFLLDYGGYWNGTAWIEGCHGAAVSYGKSVVCIGTSCPGPLPAYSRDGSTSTSGLWSSASLVAADKFKYAWQCGCATRSGCDPSGIWGIHDYVKVKVELIRMDGTAEPSLRTARFDARDFRAGTTGEFLPNGDLNNAVAISYDDWTDRIADANNLAYQLALRWCNEIKDAIDGTDLSEGGAIPSLKMPLGSAMSNFASWAINNWGRSYLISRDKWAEWSNDLTAEKYSGFRLVVDCGQTTCNGGVIGRSLAGKDFDSAEKVSQYKYGIGDEYPKPRVVYDTLVTPDDSRLCLVKHLLKSPYPNTKDSYAHEYRCSIDAHGVLWNVLYANTDKGPYVYGAGLVPRLVKPGLNTIKSALGITDEPVSGSYCSEDDIVIGPLTKRTEKCDEEDIQDIEEDETGTGVDDGEDVS